MVSESCGICGGDGRIGNSFGLTTTCPNCHGSGRRGDAGALFRDVTKTKTQPRGPNKGVAPVKQTWPTTVDGGQLATEITNSASCSNDTKARLIREIIEHEGTHGLCTKTFLKKVRKQFRPVGAP